MQIDLYTKAVLTIIASCLVYLCLGTPPVLPAAEAQGPISRVVIVGWQDGNSANTRSLVSSPLPVILREQQ